MSLEDIYEEVKQLNPQTTIGIIVNFEEFHIFFDDTIINMNTKERTNMTFLEFEEKFIDDPEKDVIIKIAPLEHLLDLYDDGKWKTEEKMTDIEKKYLEFTSSQNFIHN